MGCASSSLHQPSTKKYYKRRNHGKSVYISPPLPPLPRLSDFHDFVLEDTINPLNNSSTQSLSLPSISSRHVLMTPTKIDTTNFEICEYDYFSKLPLELIHLILPRLLPEELCALQMTSRLWYVLGMDNNIWKGVVKKWFGSNLNSIPSLKVNMLLQSSDVIYKNVCVSYMMKRICKKCFRVYREYNNPVDSCQLHPGIRDLVHDSGAPSGVYYICCGQKSKTSPGCYKSSHHDILNDPI